jgi:GNAT superfamily N-acetyltransferase
VHMKLRHDIADRRDIELVAPGHVLEHTGEERDLFHQLVLLRVVEVDDLDGAGVARHQDEPRIVGVVHEQHARERQIADRNGVAGKLRIERPCDGRRRHDNWAKCAIKCVISKTDDGASVIRKAFREAAIFTVSPASEAGLPDIARLHVASWQTAYRGFVPERILQARNVEASLGGWQATYSQFPDNLSIVRDEAARGVGFCCAGPVVDVGRSGPFQFEVYGLHVAPQFHRQGIGSLLLNNAFERMAALGCTGAIVWTFENLIQSRRFYEKHGGQVVKTGVWTVGDHHQNEVAYGWP